MKKAINQEVMRLINKQRIFSVIQDRAPVSKKAIADELGTSLTTVSTMVNELIEEGKIVHCGTSKSTGGRKSEIFQLNPDALYVLGFDLQVDRLIGVMLNFNGDLIYEKAVPLGAGDEWSVAALIRQQIGAIMAEAKLSESKLAGIGLGIPGIVDPARCLVEFAPNLEWKNVNLRQLLPLPQPLIIENEANAAALGEQGFGMAREAADFIFVSVGTGIGTGVVLNNRLYRGWNNHAGEFGHMTIIPDGAACRCGNRGCWEVYASNEAALRHYQQLSGAEPAGFDELLQRCLRDEPAALEALDRAADYLAIGLANIINGINPELLVIGGQLAAVRDRIYPRLLKRIKERCLEKSFKGFTFDFSSLDGKATALGVARLALENAR
jgi:predicted NBD/HSP70 family sugar kinase